MLNQKHYTWHVRTQLEGGHFRVYYRHHYPNGKVEENCDPRRFNSLEEAEQFAKEMRRTNRIYTELCPRTLRRWLRPLTMLQSINAWLIGQYCKIRPLSTP